MRLFGWNTRGLLAASAIAALASAAFAQSITSIGGLSPVAASESFAINADGTAVTGYGALTGGGYFAVRWTAGGGLQNLWAPPGGLRSMGFAISGDGSAVVGQTIISGGAHVFYWTVADGAHDMGTLPGQNVSYGYAISADGRVLAGGPSSGAVGHAFICPIPGSLTDAGVLPGGSSAAIYALNADGTVGTGFSGTPTGDHAVLWNSTGLHDLGVLPGGAISEGDAISADGSVIAGSSDSAGGRRAFRWTAAGGMEDLGVVPGRTSSNATGISADGSVVVGTDDYGGILWRSDLGMQDLRTFLISQGVNMGGWTSLLACYGISADGTALTGTGMFNGMRRGWVVRGLTPLCAPAVSVVPSAAATCANMAVQFAVEAAGSGPFTFAWQLETEPGTWKELGPDPMELPCGGFGYATAPGEPVTQIHIDGCAGGMTHRVRAAVSNACATTNSAPAMLTILATGDMNCDFAVDNSDIDAFVLALLDPSGYSAAFPTCALCAADTNHDGVVDNSDIDPFVACLLAGCP